jgi:hypothetical protein
MCFQTIDLPHFYTADILDAAHRFPEAAVAARRAVVEKLTDQDGSEAMFAFDLYLDALMVLGWMGDNPRASCRKELRDSIDELLGIDERKLRSDHFLRGENRQNFVVPMENLKRALDEREPVTH